MHVLRPIKEEDLPLFVELAKAAGPGLTSMPKTRHLLEKKILASKAAFNSPTKTDASYLFVLEEKGKILGCSGIIAKIGLRAPLYFYHIEEGFLKSYLDEEHPSEICSLYLHKELRKEGLGSLLSFSRFLFLATFKERFENTLTAEMRGVIDSSGKSPFWEAIKHHFLWIDFLRAQQLVQEDPRHLFLFIVKKPILIANLPKEAQEVIGKPHPNTVPALKILEKQGFSFCFDVDLFDGGPRVKASVSSIPLIQQSKIAKVIKIEDVQAPSVLISNQKLDFRACLAPILLKEEGQVVLSKETIQALSIDIGDSIRYAIY